MHALKLTQRVLEQLHALATMTSDDDLDALSAVHVEVVVRYGDLAATPVAVSLGVDVDTDQRYVVIDVETASLTGDCVRTDDELTEWLPNGDNHAER